MARLECAWNRRRAAGRPTDLNAIHVVVVAQAKVRHWGIERQVTAAGFQFAYLVPFAVRTVVNRNFCANAVSITNLILQLKGNTVTSS